MLHLPSFGMSMPGRKFTSGEGYRYGFNGKENDNEVKGESNQLDYGFRIYDPRLGKFLSIDPLTKKYPWYTPYQFAGNKPIRYVDIDGLEEGENKSGIDKFTAWLSDLSSSLHQAFSSSGGTNTTAAVAAVPVDYVNDKVQMVTGGNEMMKKGAGMMMNYQNGGYGYMPIPFQQMNNILGNLQFYGGAGSMIAAPVLVGEDASMFFLGGFEGAAENGLTKLAAGEGLTYESTLSFGEHLQTIAKNSGVKFEGGISVYSQGDATKFIIIGRNQTERVEKIAQAMTNAGYNVETITKTYPLSDQTPLQNAQWMYNQIQSGASVIDIGLDPNWTGFPNFSFDYGNFYDVETTVRQGFIWPGETYIPIKQ